MMFSYKARNAQGELLKGTMEAEDSAAVGDRLMSDNHIPVSIEPLVIKEDVLKVIQAKMSKKRIPNDDLVLLSRQIYTLIKAGVPVVRALRNLQQSMPHRPLLADTLLEIIDDLEEGQELSTAFARQTGAFPRIFINILRVGESTGRLEESFLQLSEYLELDQENTRQVKSALRYPTIVIIAIIIAMGVINVFVIPAFSGVFAKLGTDLPLLTQILITCSNFTLAWWPYMLAALMGAYFGVKLWGQSSEGAEQLDLLKTRIPLFGSIVTKSMLCRFSRSLSLSLSAGVPLLSSLSVVAGSLDNTYMEKRVLAMREKIEQGESLTRTAAASGLFTPLVLQMVSIGEETGSLDHMLDQVAQHYESEVKYELKNIGSNIEPILVVFIGVIVLILALGVFLPMWEISSGKGI